MKGELLSIGEVSKMKGVGVKSLRYYERMGVLPPVYLDPESGYRYYSMRQMVDIDIITTCIDLGIPLRELRDHMDDGGIADLEALLAWSREIAVQNLHKAEITLSQLDGYLDEARTQKQLAKQPTPYERDLPKQLLLCKEWPTKRFNLKRYTTATTELYEQAKAAGVIPLYAQGLVSFAGGAAETQHAESDTLAPKNTATPDKRACYRTWYTFVAAAIPSWMTVRQAREAIHTTGEGRIEAISAATFRGWRIQGPTLSECFEALLNRCGYADGTIIATEIWDAGINGADYAVEVLAHA